MKHLILALFACTFMFGCESGSDTTPENVGDIVTSEVTEGDIGDCVPQCANRVCGDDGCGSVCGACDGTTVCDAGQCIEAPAPSCAGICGSFSATAACKCDANCFDNGDCCEDICDVCMDTPSIATRCEPACVPDCANKECGDDGCGATCGTGCTADQTCVNGLCEEPAQGITSCDGWCGQWGDAATCNCDAECWTFGDCCEDVCDYCAQDYPDQCGGACEPTCTDDQECGDDGCGGTCGAGCAADQTCVSGLCETACEPTCTDDQECGDDGCGGTCGAGCTADQSCVSGLCETVCEPTCADGQECGGDGCGGTCGDGCGKTQTCGEDGTCGAIDCFGVDAEEVCPDGTDCYLTAEWDALLCYPDQGEGEPCSWGIGGCEEGLACVNDDETYKTATCQPMTAALGDACGFSMPDCEEGIVCDWVLPDAMQCTEYAQEGAPCGLGVGDCAEELSCWPDAIADETGQFCYAAQNIGAVCGWGAGDCDEKLSCMWDEAEDEDDVPHCYPATIEAGGQCGTGFGNCAPWLSCVMEEDASTGVCVTIALPGDVCGAGIANCASNISECTLLTEDSEDAMCMALLWPGDICGIGVGACLDGLLCIASEDGANVGVCEDECAFSGLYADGLCDEGCWMPDSDCFCVPDCAGKTCGTDGCGGSCGAECSDGEFCDSGVCEPTSCAGDPSICAETSDCVFNQDFTDLVCMEQVNEGDDCNYGDGDCAEGLLCMEVTAGAGDHACIGSTAQEGETCAFGAPMCVDGAECVWTGFEETACVASLPELELGDDCLADGVGPCPEGSECMWTNQDEDAAVCIASDQEAGEPCFWGTGMCTEGNSCVYTSEDQSETQCYPDDLLAGESCGGFAQGGCATPLYCTEDSVDSAEAICLPIAFAQEPCGYGIGYCYNGTTCLPEAPGSQSLVCTINAFLGEACGDGVAGCNSDMECITAGGLSTCQDPCAFYGSYGDGVCDETCLIYDADDCL